MAVTVTLQKALSDGTSIIVSAPLDHPTDQTDIANISTTVLAVYQAYTSSLTSKPPVTPTPAPPPSG